MEVNTQIILSKDDKNRLKAILSEFLAKKPNLMDALFAEALLTRLIDN